MKRNHKISFLLACLLSLSGFAAFGVAPVANDVTVTAYDGGRPTRIPIGEAYSDSDSLVGDLRTAIVSPASYGTATASGGFLYYEPNTNYTGADSFAWQVTDGAETSNVAQCNITVTDEPMPQTERLVLIVEERIRPEIETRLQRLKDDMELDGYSVSITNWNDTAGNFTASSNLWETLRGEYFSSDPLPLIGAVLIGELPLPDLMDEIGWETDVTYWNLQDGEFATDNYYTPDIWVSRMNGKVGDYEIVELHNLLDANHRGRSGQSRSSHDGWWFNSAYPENNSYYYPNSGYNLRYLCQSAVKADVLPTDPYTDCATAGMLGGEMMDTSSHSGSGYRLPVYDPYRMPFQVRTILMTSCHQWRRAQSFLLGRRGLTMFAPGAVHSTYMGSFNTLQDYYDDDALAEIRTTNMSWGELAIKYDSNMWREFYYGYAVFWGDMSLGATLAPHNDPPVIDTFDISSPSGAAPHTAVLTVNANDPDGSISLYEWFCRGYRYPLEDPVFTGESLSCVTNVYTKPYRYVAEVHAIDNYQHLGMSERKDVLVAPDPTQKMRVNAGYSSSSYLPHLEYTDSATNLWLHDQWFTEGTWGYTSGGEDTLITQPVENTLDDDLYQRFREGKSFSYRVPLTNGTYALSLHFADMRSTSAGERVMDINLNGERAVTGLDIVSHVGPDCAHTLTFLAGVTNNELTFGVATNSGFTSDVFLNAFTINPDTGSAEAGPTITSPLEVDAPDWTPFSYTIRSTGRDGITYTAENLPDGLELNGDTISGTPNVPVGLYEITLHATNADGTRTFTMWLNLTKPVTARIGVEPISTNVAPGAVAAFTATAYSEFDTALPVQPDMVWSVSGGGSIATDGVFTASMTTGGPYRVIAEADGITGIGLVSVTETSATNAVFVWKPNVTGSWDNAENWTPEGFTNAVGITCIADSGWLDRGATFKPTLYLLDGATLSLNPGSATIDPGALYLVGGRIINERTGPYDGRTLTVAGGVEAVSNTVSEIDMGIRGISLSTSLHGYGDLLVTGSDNFYVTTVTDYSGHIELTGVSSLSLRSNGTYSFGSGASVRVNSNCRIYQSSYGATWTVPGGIMLNGGTYYQPSRGTAWTEDSPWFIESASVMQMNIGGDGGQSDIRGPLHGNGALRIERTAESLDRAFNFRGSGSTYSNTITIAAQPTNAALFVGTSGALPTNGALASLRIEESGGVKGELTIGARKIGATVTDMPDADVKVETLTCGGRAVPAGIYSQTNPVPEDGYVFFNNPSSSLEVMNELPTPQITSLLDVDTFCNQEFDYEITADGAQPFEVEVTDKPAWMTVNGAHLGGVPTELGTYTATLEVSNEYGRDTAILTVHAYAAPGESVTITASAGAHGSIDPSGTIVVLKNYDKTFEITPDTGYAILDVLVDGSSVGAVSEYTFTAVTNDHTIDAGFALIPDAEAPSVPQDLSATAVSYSQIDLSWSASTDNVAVVGYEISRDGSYLTSVTETNYSDTGLSPDTEYTYTVLAYDTVTNKSAPSASASATTETLFAHWKLDETDGTVAADATGNGHDGSVEGSPARVAGRLDGAFSFDEVDDRVSVTDFDYTSGGAFSVSFWFNCADNSGSLFQYIFSHGTVGNQNSLNIYLFESGSSSPGILRTYLMDDDDSQNQMDVPAGLTDGAWHHYALAVDAEGSKVYIDGSLQESSSQGGDAFNPATLIAMGGRADGDADRYYGGLLDDVQIYNRPLSSNEVYALAFPEEESETFTITATAGANGSIDPDGEVLVFKSNDQAFAISPDLGYEIADVLVDGSSVGAVSNYTFTAVTNDHTIAASFAFVPDEEPPSVPQDLSATAVSYSQIDLSWSASTDNVAVVGYEISRDGSYLTSVTETNYSDTGLNPDTGYSYTVLAYDAATNKSAESSAASATTPEQPDTLVAHWKLDDGSGTNLLDSSGNGYDGTLFGDPQWVTGTNGGAVYCDGDGDWLSFPEALDMQAGTNWTVMLWFRLDTLPSVANDMWLWKYTDTTEYGDSLLYVDDDNGIKAFNGGKLDSGITVQTGVWYHVAGVKDGNGYSIYVNGEQEVVSSSYNFSDTGSGYEIFKADGRAWGHGAVDDVRVYSEALTGSQITNIMYSVETEEAFTVRIGQSASGDGSVSLSFDSEVGKLYEVLYKDNLMSTNDWQVLTNDLEGTGSQIEWEDCDPGNQRFYRIRERE